MASGRTATVRWTLVTAAAGLAALGCHPAYNSELMQAAVRGDDARVRDMVSHNANVNYSDHDGDTALHAAAEYGHPEVIRSLVRQGKAQVDVRDDDGHTPLHFAAQHGQLDAVKALVECGARVNVRDTDGWDALHYAAEAESPAIVIYLIEKGADPNGLNGDAQTPVQVANESDDRSDADREKTVAALRAHGAKD
jgi:ankyrin repeat protein